MQDSPQDTESVGPDSLPTAADISLPAGSLVAGRYVIRTVLGRGGYAIVYGAFDTDLKEEIALKILRADRASRTALNRLRREVSVARRISSPRVVRMFDVGTDGPISYLTMEIVPGESLRQRINRGPLPVDDVIAVTRAVAEGLAALHAVKVTHRDVKPENILLTENGPKIADFGLAHYLDPQKQTTATTGLVGTPSYLPPEQLRGDHVDERGDLYSLGLVMFEMLTGRTPHTAATWVGVLFDRLKGPAPDVRRFRPEAPRWLANIINRLLERHPDARYASAEEVIEALNTRRAPVSPTSRRRLGAALAVVAVFSVGVVSISKLSQAAGGEQFSHLVAPPEGGIAAVSRNGTTLWRKPQVDSSAASRWALARRSPGAARDLAVILNAQDEFRVEHVRTLSFLEPQTGRVLRSVKLPVNPGAFPRCPARFAPQRIIAADLNRDGADEILTWFSHVPEWPSFVDLYDPLTDRARIVFEGYGQHGMSGLFDIDGDGKKELILFGYNNGLGWYNAMAALRLDLPWTEGPDRSPDFGGRPEDAQNALVWYALLPRGYTSDEANAVTYDARRRLFTVRYANGRKITVTADGFLPSDRSRLPSPERQTARFTAYRRLREASRLSQARVHDRAIEEMTDAVGAAERAGDAILVEAMRKERAETLIAAGRMNEAEALLRDVVERAQYPAETAYDGARAMHLKGDLDRAITWYQLGFAHRLSVDAGKSIHEFLLGILLAHAERHEWALALAEVERFRRTYQMAPSHWTGIYREFLRWRAGDVPEIAHLDIPPNTTDLVRYWMLELRHARRESSAQLLREVELEIAAGPSETQSAMWSLRGELLALLGRHREAADALSVATALLGEDRGVSVIARGHGELVMERAKNLKEGH
jgi:tetratricopeptide (TPR) repeat protein